MGHDTHFLERLDRLAPPQVDRALALYRDHELVRGLLQHVKLPDGAPRVAIALEPHGESPHVIVARDGGFVTCLAPGMRLNGLPVIPRTQLDAIIQRVGLFRERMAVYRSATATKSDARRLFRRVYESGHLLAREDFVAMSALQPLVPAQTLTELVAFGRMLEQLRFTLRHIRRPKPMHRPMLEQYWKAFWAVGNLSLLVGMTGRELIDLHPQHECPPSLSDFAMHQGITALALRGVWTASRFGKAMVPMYKQQYASNANDLSLIDAGLSLIAIGSRHGRVRAEIRKALHAHGQPMPEGARRYFSALRTYFAENGDTAFDHPERLLDAHRTLGRALWHGLTGKGRQDHPFFYRSPEEIPDDLAGTAATLFQGAFLENPNALAQLTLGSVWAARAEATDFFLPRRAIGLVKQTLGWKPEMTLRLLQVHRDAHGGRRFPAHKRVRAREHHPERAQTRAAA